MLEQIKYQNHMGEVFEFGKNGIFVNASDIHDYSWNVTKKNNRVASLDYAVSTRKLPVVVVGGTDAERNAAVNRLFEVVEKDALALKHGKIILGDYYFRCFVTKSAKKNYLTANGHMVVTLTLTSDYPYWIKETPYYFVETASTFDARGDLDYGHDYPHDYFNNMITNALNNSDFVPSNFRMHINGPCSNPSVYVAGHLYQVFCDVNDGAYLTIDSSAKTVTLTANDGTVTNVFNSRNKESYIFEKIPAGNCAVARAEAYNMEIVLLEERSEPKWT